MQVIEFTEPIHVVGLGLRTSNERAFEDIPAHWGRFHQSGVLASIPDRVGEDLFGVYTHFEHPGIDNLGVYSLIIGARVNGASPAPPGLASTTIPAARRAVFPVDKGHPERVGERWRDIWASADIVKTYLCDHEHYKANGEIDIVVGIC